MAERGEESAEVCRAALRRLIHPLHVNLRLDARRLLDEHRPGQAS